MLSIELSQAPETKDMLSDRWYGCCGWKNWRVVVWWSEAKTRVWRDKVQAGNRLLLPVLMIK